MLIMVSYVVMYQDTQIPIHRHKEQSLQSEKPQSLKSFLNRSYVCRAGLKSSVLCSGLVRHLLQRRRDCVDCGITSGDDGLWTLAQVVVTFWLHLVKGTLKAVVWCVWHYNVWASALILHISLDCWLYCTPFVQYSCKIFSAPVPIMFYFTVMCRN